MRLSDYWQTLRSGWRLVAALTLLGGLVAVALSVAATPAYRATASVYFSLPSGDTASDLSQGSTFTQAQMLSYAELATQPVVLDRVIDDLDLDTTAKRLAEDISAEASTQTVIIAITATADDPDLAADLANTTADELRTVARELAPTDAQGDPTIDAATVGEATPPQYPFSPATKRNLVIGLVAGLLLGVAATIARELLDTRVRDDDEAEQLTQAPVLAEVSKDRAFTRSQVVMQSDPRGTASEAFRRLRINLRYLRTAHQVDVVTMTSSLSGEGKSTTALNFAFACAEAGDRVLLVDGDLRQPAVAAYTGLEGAAGLTTILADGVPFDDVVQPWGTTTRFDVLTSGEVPPNPTEMIESDAMRKLLGEVRARYDLVVVDAPPLLPVSDAALFAARSSGAIVVAHVRKVHRAELADAVASLRQVGATVLGLVVNGTSAQAQGGYYGYAEPRSRWRRLWQHPAQRRRDQARRRASARAQAADPAPRSSARS